MRREVWRKFDRVSQEFADLCRKFKDRGMSGAGLVLTNVPEQI